MAGTQAALQRLFIGVPLPLELLGFLEAAQAIVAPTPGLRLLRPDQLHVTLAFIGEVDQAKAAAAQAVVDSLPADMGGEGRITRFLMLPSAGKARVVSLEIDDGAGVFARLFEHVMGGLEAAGVMKREKRPFRPHLTVARLKDPAAVQPRSESGEARFAVESVCLYRSELKREGAVYTVITRASFWAKDGVKA
jgi:RNA 2',3'-cyclic 3'-phosphodiesterase